MKCIASVSCYMDTTVFACPPGWTADRLQSAFATLSQIVCVPVVIYYFCKKSNVKPTSGKNKLLFIIRRHGGCRSHCFEFMGKEIGTLYLSITA